MSVKVGFEFVMYRNTGVWGSPTWAEIENLGDVTTQLSKEKIDASKRGTAGSVRYKQYRSGMIDSMLSFKMFWDDADADFLAILAAFLSGSTIDIVALSNTIVTSGARGPRAEWEVFKCERGEPLNGMVTADIEIAPSALSANGWGWYVV